MHSGMDVLFNLFLPLYSGLGKGIFEKTFCEKSGLLIEFNGQVVDFCEILLLKYIQ